MYAGYPDTSGTVLIVAPEDDSAPIGYEEDASLVDETFGVNCLNYAPLTVQAESVEMLLPYFRVVAKYKPNEAATRFIISYFTGYGGCDQDGRVYMWLGMEKLYINDLVEILDKRINKKHHCVFLLELSTRPNEPSIPSSQIKLPRRNNFIIALSGLTQEGISRDDSGGKWTRELCEALKQNVPLQEVLDDIQQKLPELSSQYIATTGLLFLNGQ